MGNDSLADVQCAENFQVCRFLENGCPFEEQLCRTLLQLQHHILSSHSGSCENLQCYGCGMEVRDEDPKYYWRHMTVHLDEYRDVLPLGMMPAEPILSDLAFPVHCTFGCALRFNNGYHFFAHLLQDHWQEVMSSVSSCNELNWPCPTSNCSFLVSRLIDKSRVTDVGLAMSQMNDHLSLHCPSPPPDICCLCRNSLNHLEEHLKWQHLADHTNINLVWCEHCKLCLKRSKLSDHVRSQCKMNTSVKEKWILKERQLFIEEMENIKDRYESLQKIHMVVFKKDNASSSVEVSKIPNEIVIKPKKRRKGKRRKMNKQEKVQTESKVNLSRDRHFELMMCDILDEIIVNICDNSRVSSTFRDKKQDAWNSLTPTPKLDKPRPPARYGGVGEFLSKLKNGIFNFSANDYVDFNESKGSVYLHRNILSSVNGSHPRLETNTSVCPKEATEVESDTEVEPYNIELPTASENEPKNVSTPDKFVCTKCGTKFAKALILQLHMAVHK